MSYEEKRRRLVMTLSEEGYIRSQRVAQVIMKVPRELFVPEEYREMAYEDRPLPIGYDQTISAPSIVAYMTELLNPLPGEKVLEVGTGSGYQAIILAELVSPGGMVWSIERIPQIAEAARKRVEMLGYGDRVKVVVGDGSLGYPEEAPYDKIMVTASAPEVPPPLIEQLRTGGKMVIPVGHPYMQNLYVVRKGERGEIHMWRDIAVVFVPLKGKYGWRE
ncbi:MAG: protein-L-isoaspartate(D-aspartate) O-methyltransferase [Acidilobaceae archaeon]|nr:protein-L-isoaspartate(D-aspartate) O-methyltransferase [Acidilobaceae archaeon]MCX8165544.1 protein-L-isoaspartate(D-aspartate) O-methyltransferase [Acidilobaceae archaeon]MDW7973971.1 protein-L-isoaspartate(D-aspartate) O-methyltransferase [Sulfolobales archaeon]